MLNPSPSGGAPSPRAALLSALLTALLALAGSASAQTEIPSEIVGGTYTVAPGDPSVVPVGGTGIHPSGVLSIQDTLTNAGESIQSVGTIENDFLFVNDGGSLYSDGSFVNRARFDNLGNVTNGWMGVFQNDGLLVNQGLIDNQGSFSGVGDVENSGAIFNQSYFQTDGTLTNALGASIQNYVDFDIDGVFYNYGSFVNSGSQGNVRARPLLLYNEGEMRLEVGSRFEHQGVFENQGRLVNEGVFEESGAFEHYVQLENWGSFTVMAGATFGGTGSITNLGQLELGGDRHELFGSIYNEVIGEVRIGGETESFGQITNYGRIVRTDSPGQVWRNQLYLENFGTLEIQGHFSNEGSILSDVAASIDNAGLFENQDLVFDVGELRNRAGARFVNNNYILKESGVLINEGTFDNSGLLDMAGVSDARLVNQGVFTNAGSGALEVGSGGIENYGLLEIHGAFVNDFELRNDGTIEYHTAQPMQTELISGSGTMRNVDPMQVVIDARVRLSPGGFLGEGLDTMTFEGHFGLAETNVLRIEVAPYATDRIEVVSAGLPSVLALDGRLELEVADAGIEAGMFFDIVQAVDVDAMLIGEFAQLVGTGLPAGLSWVLEYGSMIGGEFAPVADPYTNPFSIVRVTAVPEPGTALLLGLGLCALGRWGRSSRLG